MTAWRDSAALSRRHFPALDGLRGIAILAVMFYHYDRFGHAASATGKAIHAVLGYGYLGVDLFFVLSGFLITGILIDSRDSRGYFRVFYLRRFLRIFPVYYAYLALVFVGEVVTSTITGATGWHGNYWWYLTYLQNWSPGYGANDRHLMHLWSLAVEEQFYVLWPMVVWLTPPRWLAWVCGVIAALALAGRMALILPLGAEAVWRLTPFRMDSLCLGALAAIVLRSEALPLARRWAGAAAIACLAVFIASQFGTPPFQAAGTTAISVVFTVAVLGAVTNGPRFLSSSFLRTIGKYSYAMYLFHLAPSLFLQHRLDAWLDGKPDTLSTAVRLVYIPSIALAVFCIARLSWLVIERPFLRLKEHVTLG